MRDRSRADSLPLCTIEIGYLLVRQANRLVSALDEWVATGANIHVLLVICGLLLIIFVLMSTYGSNTLSWAPTSTVWAICVVICELVGFVSLLVVNEREKGAVALHLYKNPLWLGAGTKM